jgi:hypothetical protein
MSQYEREYNRACTPFPRTAKHRLKQARNAIIYCQHGNGQHPIPWQPLSFCLFVGGEGHNNSAFCSRRPRGLVHFASTFHSHKRVLQKIHRCCIPAVCGLHEDATITGGALKAPGPSESRSCPPAVMCLKTTLKSVSASAAAVISTRIAFPPRPCQIWQGAPSERQWDVPNAHNGLLSIHHAFWLRTTLFILRKQSDDPWYSKYAPFQRYAIHRSPSSPSNSTLGQYAWKHFPDLRIEKLVQLSI